MQEHIRSIAAIARINLQQIQEQQEERESKEASHFYFALRNEITKFKGNCGSMECPKCKNVLVWTKASNRHISAYCRTRNCICLME